VITFHGPWQISVVTKAALFDQRLVVRTGTGTVIIPGDEGVSRIIDEQKWSLSLEHNHWGRGWRPNVRVTPGPVSAYTSGGRSQELWSTDWDFDGHDPRRRNLVIRLDQIVDVQGAPTPAPNPAGLLDQIAPVTLGVRPDSGLDSFVGTAVSQPPPSAIPRVSAPRDTRS
jgi:hypothetical protein